MVGLLAAAALALVVVVLAVGPLGGGPLSGGPRGGVATGGPPSAASSSSVAPTSASAWKVLAASDTAGAVWSPDGRWLLVWDRVTNGTAADRHVSLDDAAGNRIRTYEGEYPLWLDARSFVITRAGRSYLGTLEAGRLTLIQPTFPSGAPVSSGHGALAYETTGALDASAHFVVWTATGGTTTPRPGVPADWSHDGTKLAIWHWTSGSGPQSSGWLEVVSWPGMRPLAALHADLGLPFALFDPSDRYVFDAGHVLDLATGTVTTPIAVGIPGLPAWNNAGQLVVPSLVDGSVTTYDIHGVRRSVVSDVGDSASASADGSLVVIWFNSQQRPIVLLGRGGQQSIPVPGPVQPPDPTLSPDGSGLIVTCAVDGPQEALLLVR